MVKTEYKITHWVENEVNDFDLTDVPTDHIGMLLNVLKNERQTRNAAACAPSFKEERAMQHERYLLDCQKKNLTPKQVFIDFPL